MPDDLTNLLPTERRDALARNYFLRLAVVAVLFAVLLTLVSMILMVPTYVLLTESARLKQARLATIESTFSATDEAALTARLNALSTSTAALSALANAPSASARVRSALAIGRAGVTISGFAYTPAVGKSSGTLALSGVAQTRDALRNYQLLLQSAPFALAAELPVSTFANDNDIVFTIIVTLAS